MIGVGLGLLMSLHFGMFGNTRVGDCMETAATNTAIYLQAVEHRHTNVKVNPRTVVADWEAITGGGDNGTTAPQMWDWWSTHSIGGFTPTVWDAITTPQGIVSVLRNGEGVIIIESLPAGYHAEAIVGATKWGVMIPYGQGGIDIVPWATIDAEFNSAIGVR